MRAHSMCNVDIRHQTHAHTHTMHTIKLHSHHGFIMRSNFDSYLKLFKLGGRYADDHG